jgi:hypothetical protein
MSWTTNVVQVLAECKDKDGKLRAKWEITQVVSDEDRKLPAGLQKTSFYTKDGALTRGYPQAFNMYDLTWIAKNWSKIMAALSPEAPREAAPQETTKKTPQPTEEAPANIEEVPF